MNIVETIDVSVRVVAPMSSVGIVTLNQIATLPSNPIPAPNNDDYNNNNNDQGSIYPDTQIPMVRMNV